MRLPVLLGVLAIWSSAAMGQSGLSQLELELRLKAAEQERDDLRREVALLKLRLSTAEEKLAKTVAGAANDDKKEPVAAKAPADTAVTDHAQGADAPAVNADDDDDVDDAGVSKTTQTWDVKVTSKQKLSTQEIEQQAAAQRTALATTRSQIAAAKTRLDKMQFDNDYWQRYYFSRTNKQRPFSDEDLGRVRAEIKKLEGVERAGKVRLTSLEREKAQVAQTLVVTVEETRQGTVMKIMAKGAAMSTAEALQIGRRYRIDGRRMGPDLILLVKASALDGQ